MRLMGGCNCLWGRCWLSLHLLPDDESNTAENEKQGQPQDAVADGRDEFFQAGKGRQQRKEERRDGTGERGNGKLSLQGGIHGFAPSICGAERILMRDNKSRGARSSVFAHNEIAIR